MQDFSYTSPIYDLLMAGGFLKAAASRSNVIYDAEVVDSIPSARPMRNVTPKSVHPVNAPVVSPLSSADNAIVPFNNRFATTSNDLAKPNLWSRASGALKRNPKLAAILGGVGFLGGGLGTYAWLRPKTKKKPLPDPNLTYTVPKYMI